MYSLFFLREREKERWNSDFVTDRRIRTKGVNKEKGEQEFHYRI